MKQFLRVTLSLVIPFVVLVVSYYSFSKAGDIPQTFLPILPYISYVFLGIAMLLSWRFNKSRVFFIGTVLGIGQLTLTLISPGSKAEILFFAVSVLIPINVLVFSVLKERGILTMWGMLRVGFVIAQILFVYSIVQNPDAQIPFIYQKRLLESQIFDFLILPQVAVMLFFFVFSFLLIRQSLRPNFLDSACIGVLFAALYGLWFWDKPMALPIFFAGAGLSLIIGIIQNTYSMAYLDELTGLPARRALREHMLKLGNRYVITMLDIDFFKKFNDKYGHDIGDEVLKLVASSLKQVTGGGKAFRYGGEEFTILFPNKRVEEVIPHLEELREKVGKTGYTYYGKNTKTAKKTKSAPKQLFVTISLGVAEKKEPYKTADEVMKAADTALYRAKKKGRNCVSK